MSKYCKSQLDELHDRARLNNNGVLDAVIRNKRWVLIALEAVEGFIDDNGLPILKGALGQSSLSVEGVVSMHPAHQLSVLWCHLKELDRCSDQAIDVALKHPNDPI